MSTAFAAIKNEPPAGQFSRGRSPSWSPKVQAFSSGRQDEVLAFLAQRPLHTAFMAGLIRDNGLVSFQNRGVFYGCRDQSDRLIGVALIGPKTMIDARDEVALEVLANLIPNNLTEHLLRIERVQLDFLMSKYADAGREPRLVTGEVLLQQVKAAPDVRPEPNLRLAVRKDLESVVLINAALGLEESGVDPLVRDWDGMWRRTARRIDQGRVWVLIEDGLMIFKADIVSDTPEAAYLEGVYVPPDFRRRGHGLRCMTQLARNLLARVGSLCLVANEKRHHALAFYEKLGYENRGSYSTAYFSAV